MRYTCSTIILILDLHVKCLQIDFKYPKPHFHGLQWNALGSLEQRNITVIFLYSQPSIPFDQSDIRTQHFQQNYIHGTSHLTDLPIHIKYSSALIFSIFAT